MKSRVVSGLILAAGVAVVAHRVRALSPSGAIAAAFIGAAVHTGTGVRGNSAMLAYFATASALGRLPANQLSRQQRGNRRDAVQVLANGGPVAAFALLHALVAKPSTIDAAAGFYGSLSAAAADTWATEIGTRWGGQPRSIVTSRQIKAGESGGVTFAGLAATVLASMLMAAIAQIGEEGSRDWVRICITGGVAGSLTDSLLGALLQEQRWCEHCETQTELAIHSCGKPTAYLRGIPAMNNDVVNFVAVITGGLLASAMPSTEAKLTGRNGSRVEYVTTLTSSRLPIHLRAS